MTDDEVIVGLLDKVHDLEAENNKLRNTLEESRKSMQQYRDHMFKQYLGFEGFDPKGIDFARQIIKVMDGFIKPVKEALKD